MPGTAGPSALLCLAPSSAACPELKLVSSVIIPNYLGSCLLLQHGHEKRPPSPSDRSDWTSYNVNPISLGYFPCQWGLFPLLLGDKLMGFLPTSLSLLLLLFLSACFLWLLRVFSEALVLAASLASSIVLLPPMSPSRSTPALSSTRGEGEQRCFLLQFSGKTVLTPFLSPVGWLCPPGALHPRNRLQQPSSLRLALLSQHREREGQLSGQPASQPRMDLQWLDLKVWLQLMVSGKTGAGSTVVRLCPRS